MDLSVELIGSAEQLGNDGIANWNRLAANPFQRWEWLGSWWSEYGPGRTLYVLAVKRAGEIIGYAPWFLERRLSTGRTIQFLGSGKACSDHLSLLVKPADTKQVADALAQWLLDVHEENPCELQRSLIWDAIEWIGADEADEPVNALVDAIQARGLQVQRTQGESCYVIDLPAHWEDYVRCRSKSGRREMRQAEKFVNDGVLVIRMLEDEQAIEEAWDVFVRLHQLRRHALGTTGCFDHPPFGSFLRKAASELLKAGMLKLVIATANGAPVSAQFALVDDDTWYYYQSGMDPNVPDVRPGSTLLYQTIRTSIETGRTRFDMLRGDEAYKLRWRAEAVAMQEVRICSPTHSAQMRNRITTAGVVLKNLVKSSLGGNQHHHA